MEQAICDHRGRIVIPKQIRAAFGEQFMVVPGIDEIILLPVPKNPLRSLASLGAKAKIGKKSLQQLKQAIHQQAAEELNVRRH